MYSLDRKRKIQKKAKNSIAKKLETLNSKDKSFIVNVNGFLGYVKVDIPIPLKQFTTIKKRSRNVPIYIISAP